MTSISSTSSSQTNNNFPSPIIVAMDFNNAADCLQLAKQLDPKLCRLKIGKELFTAAGPQLVEQLRLLDFEIFLDLKFHDIPNTVAKAIQSAIDLDVWMVDVHASGGAKMLDAAKRAIDSSLSVKPLLIAVTVLTSMSAEDLQGLGINQSPEEQVLRLASLAKAAECDGVVCSALEASVLKAHFGGSFTLVTPGIRPLGSSADDQQRIMTPVEAMQNGSDYLVIGRPITQAPKPAEACEMMLSDIFQSVTGGI